MQIYQSEIDAGLTDLIKNNSISIACDLFDKNNFSLTEDRNKLLQALANANPNQKDLFYKHSILASVGWNANDDVFDKVETWKARSTPTDKQINFMHNELEIIGHSTQSSVYDQNGVLIPDSTDISLLPDKFDVITEFVLYQMWDNEERSKMMEKLISEIVEGKWYVSMECRFPAFDYAIIDTDGSHKTVARNSDTAFLSKHLKAYGGTGEYEGRKVGRLIRNFFFSGQGIVDKPANPRSIIFNNALAFNSKGSLIIKGNKQMEEELKKQIAELKAQLEAANAEKMKEKMKEKDDEMAECKKNCADAVKASEDKVAALEAQIKAKDEAIATLTKDFSDTKAKLDSANAEIEAGKKAKAQAERVSKLVSAGLKDEDAKSTAAKFEGVTDAQFDDIVSVYKTAAVKTEGKTEEKTTASVVDAKVEPNVTLNTDETAKAEAAMKTISEFLGGNVMKHAAQANKSKKN